MKLRNKVLIGIWIIALIVVVIYFIFKQEWFGLFVYVLLWVAFITSLYLLDKYESRTKR